MFEVKKRRVGGPTTRVGSSMTPPGSIRQAFGRGSGSGSMTPSGMVPTGGTGMDYTRVAPVRDRLDTGTVAHDWIPQDIRTQNKVMRTIYLTDPVVGPALDFYREIPFGPIILGGIKDKKRLQLYQDALEAINIQRYLPFLAGDLLTVGRLICHLILDEQKGYWTDMIIHDSDWIQIDFQPILGEEPLIDLIVPPEYRRWAMSRDPRVIKSRKKLDKRLVRMMAAGGTIPLSSENTIFVARKASANDLTGTGMPFRILPLIAIEYAYINAEVTGMRRRAAPILYATMGIDGQWEASPDEMAAVQDLLIATEEDPVGAKMVLRNGVELNTMSGHTEIAKYGEQWQWLKEAKLQGLGMNEAFATGESSWSYLESMLSLGMERIRNFRAFVANEVIMEGLLSPLAKLHGFHRRTEAEISHRIRTSSLTDDNLDLPSLKWSRSLQPSADRDYLDILSQMEEKGVPITIRQWAQAGGFDIDEAMNSFDSDIETRKEIKVWEDEKKKVNPSGGGDEESNHWGSARVAASVAALPVWTNGEFGQLRKGEVAEVVKRLDVSWQQSKPFTIKKWKRVERMLKSDHHYSEEKVQTLQYLLTRSGAIKLKLPPKAIVTARDNLLSRVNGKPPDRALMREVYWLNGELSKHDHSDPERVVAKYNQQHTVPWIQPADKNLLTGVTD